MRQRTKADEEEFFAALYQLAGDVLLSEPVDPKIAKPEDRTPGQRARMTELLLDVLSRPEIFTAEGIKAKHDLALMR